MTSEAFCVRNDKFVRAVCEGVSQRPNFGLRRPTPSRGVGLMGEKHGVRSDFMAVDAPLLFHGGDEVVHRFSNVINIKASAVEGGIGGGRTEQFCNWLNTTLFRF